MPPLATPDIPQESPIGQLPPRMSRTARLRFTHLSVIVLLWLVVFGGSLATPPLLDDADATHAQAAQSMLRSGDWVTLHVDGVRYLEKAPLPYWIAALNLRLFGNSAFAIHLPLALTVLALALLGYAWSRRAFSAFVWDDRAAFYTALFTLTSAGVFLFTRIFIPDALLSLLLALALFAFLRALDSKPAYWAYIFWIALACAVLTKGLVALVFGIGTAIIFLVWTSNLRRLELLKPWPGVLLFLAIATPWHILAGLRNRGAGGGHGFFWFYFVNEHFLRFLGRRVPNDYNKLPGLLYWSLHVLWLFPWSLFVPATLLYAWRKRGEAAVSRDLNARGGPLSRFELSARRNAPATRTLAGRTVLLLAIFSALVLGFFAFSTNQEYYTFPAYLPLLMLVAASLAAIEHRATDGPMQRAMTFGYAGFTLIGLAIAAALAWGLWTSRHLSVPDIGSVLAHRGVGNYTLSMSHFFDLTGPSFAALRLPSAIAAAAFAVGPVLAWILYAKRHSSAALLSVAATSAAFLVASHLALVRFTPILSSQNFAQHILDLERHGTISADSEVLLFGDQSFGSSIPFYLDRNVMLVDGRTTSMFFGSTFPDAPPIFLTPDQLVATWGLSRRKLLFVPLEQRANVDRLLGNRQIILYESSGKALITDRPMP